MKITWLKPAHLVHGKGKILEHNVIEKNVNDRNWLRALKSDFDTIWMLYGCVEDKHLTEPQLKVKYEMIDMLEQFFDGEKKD